MKLFNLIGLIEVPLMIIFIVFTIIKKDYISMYMFIIGLFFAIWGLVIGWEYQNEKEYHKSILIEDFKEKKE